MDDRTLADPNPALARCRIRLLARQLLLTRGRFGDAEVQAVDEIQRLMPEALTVLTSA